MNVKPESTLLLNHFINLSWFFTYICFMKKEIKELSDIIDFRNGSNDLSWDIISW